MQINGVGSSHSDMHHVTTCIHNHKTDLEEKVGGAASSASNVTQSTATTAQQTGETFSLSSWLQNTLSGAKRLLAKIWGSDTSNIQGETIAQAGLENVTDINAKADENVLSNAVDVQSNLQQNQQQQTSHMNTLHASQIEAASATVQPVQSVNNNPYFSAIEEKTASQQNIWQKIRVRFQNITGFLTKRFSFSNSSSFQAKQERPKEDLRRHSRYREDDVEIDCIITDDSYLLDSYNKRGEYSNLSGDVQSNLSVRK